MRVFNMITLLSKSYYQSCCTSLSIL